MEHRRTEILPIQSPDANVLKPDSTSDFLRLRTVRVSRARGAGESTAEISEVDPGTGTVDEDLPVKG